METAITPQGIFADLQAGKIDTPTAAKLLQSIGPLALTPRVSPHGALSVYGLGHWPVTLYAGQWKRLAEWIKDGNLDKALEGFKGKLAEREGSAEIEEAKLTWDRKRKRWKKVYKGRQYYFATSKDEYDKMGYKRAWHLWLKKKAEVDGKK